jgi:hypothetical protein
MAQRVFIDADIGGMPVACALKPAFQKGHEAAGVGGSGHFHRQPGDILTPGRPGA